MHPGFVTLRYGPGEFPFHDVVGDVGRDRHVRQSFHQLERIEQVRRDAVAVGFHGQRHARLPADLQQAGDDIDAFADTHGEYLDDEVEVLGFQFQGQIDITLESRNRIGKGVAGTAQTGIAHQASRRPAFVGMLGGDIHAVETGLGNHADLLVERPFMAIGTPPFHGPDGLKDFQALCHPQSWLALLSTSRRCQISWTQSLMTIASSQRSESS